MSEFRPGNTPYNVWTQIGEELHLRVRAPEGHDVTVWIGPRQNYCDRGHWQFCVDQGIPSLDGADSFPRYYMELVAAVREAQLWLRWRLRKIPAQIPRGSNLQSAFNLLKFYP